ncbi:MAG: hypothetical protein VYD27_00830 [Candidatus Thermoplasmatota archaeon]|nr:hypothetical protein [Candidatus Thermoplasmatota archaeon]
MEASLDRNWLLGDPEWWNLQGEPAPDFMPGELAPPLEWVSTTPRVGNFGWCRQRLRPLAWAPFFLLLAIVPLAFPGRTPDDQVLSAIFFSVAWGLVFLPILFSRNSQPMSDNSLLSLPLDWNSLAIASILFSLHILVDVRFGWLSYGIFWLAYIRTIQLVQAAMMTPPARFLLPVEPEDWEGSLEGPWVVSSAKWSRNLIASADFSNGKLTLTGSSRSGQDFLALAFIHKSGFVHDPFHERSSDEPGLSELLSTPVPVIGRAWPEKFLQFSEEE